MKLRTGLVAVTLVTGLTARPGFAQQAPLTAEAAQPSQGKAAGAPEPDGDDADSEAAPGGEPEASRDEPTPAPFGSPDFGPRYTIEQIVVRGNRKTAAALILGEVGIRPGDVLTASDGRVEAARIHLLSLGFFLDVHLAVQKGSRRGGAILIVDVEERGTIILNGLYLGSSAATTFWGGLDLAENNLLGRGITLGGGFVASTRPQVANATRDFGARLHTLVPPTGGTGISISASAIAVSSAELYRVSGPPSSPDPDNFVAARLRRMGGVVGIGRSLTHDLRLLVDLREESIEATLPAETVRVLAPGVTRPIDFGVGRGFSRVASLSAGLDYDTRSDPLVPRAGTHAAVTAEGASSGVISSDTFLKLTLQGSHYRPTRRGHIVGVHVFGGALFGTAPIFDRFYVGDLNLLLPPRVFGIPFSTQPSRNLLGTAIDDHRYDTFAGRVVVEYAVPLWRRHKLIYSGDAFIAFGAFGMGSRGAFLASDRTGFARWPVDLTGDFGVRFDTMIGVFSASFANALGRIPF